MSNRKIILVTGAASSGKSEWAESLAQQTQQQVIYIATAVKNELDSEWMAKILKHQRRRPSNWINWEIPQGLVDAIATAPPQTCLLVDSLGTWVTNWLTEQDKVWQVQTQQLVQQLEISQQMVILVAEETGWGVVPAYELGRLFRNRLGDLIRQVGLIADEVYLVVGGYAVDVSKIGIKLEKTSKN